LIIKQLQRFLGMVNFYRRFLPNCAQVLHPFTADSAVDRYSPGVFSKSLATPCCCFNAAASFSNSRTGSLATDASDTHIGGIMQQKSRKPLAAP
jgi:hypothetical protein